MGQKVNPIGLRLNINRTWDSRWYADGGDYADMLHQDLKMRKHLHKRLKNSGVSKIVIERPAKKTVVTLYTSKPGIVIGKKGADIEKMKQELGRYTNDDLHLNIVEVRKPETDATLIAENVAQQLERRGSFRRAMKRAVQSAIRLGAKGIRINTSGRLGGAEIARMEWYREGQVPLHTLRADIDYGTAEANTTYGIIGIKVWVYKGEVLTRDPFAHEKRIAGAPAGAPPKTNTKETPQIVTNKSATKQKASDSAAAKVTPDKAEKPAEAPKEEVKAEEPKKEKVKEAAETKESSSAKKTKPDTKKKESADAKAMADKDKE